MPHKINAFKENLEQIILEERPNSISVDYDPDEYLTIAAEKSGFYIGNLLPIKTITWVDTGEYRLGYSGKICSLNQSNLLSPVPKRKRVLARIIEDGSAKTFVYKDLENQNSAKDSWLRRLTLKIRKALAIS